MAVPSLVGSGANGRIWPRYDVGRAAGGVGMGKLMGVEQLFEGRHFDREVIIRGVRCIFASG